MLFTYSYISHNIEKLHAYLDFLFLEVWLKADGEFDADKLIATDQFDDPNELYQIYEDLGNTEGEWAYFFNSSIELIYDEFLELGEDDRTELLQGYQANNNIEGLCNDKGIKPVMYSEIAAKHQSLAEELHAFYSVLYGTNSPFNLKIFGFLNKKLIAEYDKEFMNANNKEICPFCGINPLKGNNHSYREAYDHYIPKALYPFNSVNFKNLAPMCHECNSTYKLTKFPIYNNDSRKIDPLLRENDRVRAFYPYAEDHPDIIFEIILDSNDILNLKPEEVKLSVLAEGFDEQIESWMRVFGIEERFKALICSKGEGIVWYNSIVEGYDNAVAQGSPLTREQYYEAQLWDAKYEPLSSYGFLKSVFLEECNGRGLFNF